MLKPTKKKLNKGENSIMKRTKKNFLKNRGKFVYKILKNTSRKIKIIILEKKNVS